MGSRVKKDRKIIRRLEKAGVLPFLNEHGTPFWIRDKQGRICGLTEIKEDGQTKVHRES